MKNAQHSLSVGGYEAAYNGFCTNVGFLVKAMSEEAGSTINRAVKAGGQTSVQALFDALMDAGHRMVLVRALDTPSIPDWVREQLRVFLYGTTKQTAALFMPRMDGGAAGGVHYLH